MRDGLKLSCDIYINDNLEKRPTILLRTPYDKSSESIIDTGKKFMEKGFTFIACDVRGRGGSDGKFIPYFNEANDGYDIIEWCADNYSDGNIITYGASYSARIQWLAALKKPPHLEGMISIVPPSDPFVENPTGLPSPLYISWLFLLSGHLMHNINNINWNKILYSLPLIDMPEQINSEIPFWKEYFIHDPDSDFWKPLFYQSKIKDLKLPVLHISGWYDDEQIGTFINFINMNKSKSSFIRENQYMIIGPWEHNVNNKITNIDFGNDSIIDLFSMETKFINSIIKKEFNDKKVNLFLMGLNEWKSYNKWPVPEYKNKKLYLKSNGNANSINGDGLLEFSKPCYEIKKDIFVYNPENPVPFITDNSFLQIGGADDYSEVEKRNDILIYTTKILKKDITVIGNIKAELYVSSSAPDTDFTAKLLDVHPDNYAQRLLDNIVRLKYRNGYQKIEYINNNDVIKINIDLWNTAQVFKAGHRIRIEVSSSAFPKYARNLNVRGNQGLIKDYNTAKQTLYHGIQYPSCIYLPVVKNF